MEKSKPEPFGWKDTLKIDTLRAQVDNLNQDIADLMEMDPVALARQVGNAADDPLFLYGIVGGKDVGKTSIINQLAGANISLDSDLLDEGTHIAVAYYHQKDLNALKKRFVHEAGERIKFVAHERDELKNVVLMDFPDFDSRFLSHKDDVRRLKRYLQGLVWVTTPRKYGDYAFLDQLQSIAQSHDNYIIILNKVDQIVSRVPLESARREVLDFLSDECIKRSIPSPDPQQFFMISALDPDRYEFQHIRDRLIRSHSASEIAEAKIKNLRAEFGKNFERMHTAYGLVDRVQEIERALEMIRQEMGDQFSDDYYKTVCRRFSSLETVQRNISKIIFGQQVRAWPILRMLYYPLAGVISGFGGRFAFDHTSKKKGPDSLREILRYKGLPASLRMQKIRTKIESAFPGLKRELGVVPDLPSIIEALLIQLLSEYEDQITARLAAALAQPGRLKRALVYVPLIWFPFLQPLLLKMIDLNLSLPNLKEILAVCLSLFGAGSLLTGLVFLILFYTLWLIFIYARCARSVQRKGEEEFQNLWYAQFLTRLEQVLARPLLDIRAVLSAKKMQLDQIQSAVESELQQMSPVNGADVH